MEIEHRFEIGQIFIDHAHTNVGLFTQGSPQVSWRSKAFAISGVLIKLYNQTKFLEL